MARCLFLGKGSLKGNNVSKSKLHIRKWQRANIHKKRIYDEELGRFVRVKLSSKALKTINKVGLSSFLRKKNMKLKEIEIK